MVYSILVDGQRVLQLAPASGGGGGVKSEDLGLAILKPCHSAFLLGFLEDFEKNKNNKGKKITSDT